MLLAAPSLFSCTHGAPPASVQACFLLAKGHVSPNLAETGSPFGTRAAQPLCQGLTVQLFGPYPLPRAVSSLCLCASHSVAENAWTFLITFGGSRARLCLSQVFIVQAGVRNVECYNLGQRVVWGAREPGLWVLCILCPVPSEVSSSGRLSSPFSSPGSIGPLSSFSSLVVPGPDLGCTVSLG